MLGSCNLKLNLSSEVDLLKKSYSSFIHAMLVMLCEAFDTFLLNIFTIKFTLLNIYIYKWSHN